MLLRTRGTRDSDKIQSGSELHLPDQQVRLDELRLCRHVGLLMRGGCQRGSCQIVFPPEKVIDEITYDFLKIHRAGISLDELVNEQCVSLLVERKAGLTAYCPTKCKLHAVSQHRRFRFAIDRQAPQSAGKQDLSARNIRKGDVMPSVETKSV